MDTCDAGWGVCTACAPKVWSISVIDLVFMLFGMINLLPGIVYFIAILITRDIPDAYQVAKNKASVVLLSPLLAVYTLLIMAWNPVASAALAPSINSKDGQLAWRDLWNTEKASSPRLGMMTVALGTMAFFTILGGLPAIPTVDAAECSSIENFTRCEVPPGHVIQVGAHAYKVRARSVITIGMGAQNTGTQRTWYRNTNLTGRVACSRAVTLQEYYDGMRAKKLVVVATLPLQTGSKGRVHSELCFGASVGFTYPTAWLGITVSAVGVYCPGAKITTQPIAGEADSLLDIANGVRLSEFTGEARTTSELCTADGTTCVPFPYDAVQGEGLLYISAHGVSASSEGAIGSVMPPMQGYPHVAQVMCQDNQCWQTPVDHGTCPQLWKPSTVGKHNVASLLKPDFDFAYGDPSEVFEVSPAFIEKYQPQLADALVTCATRGHNQVNLPFAVGIAGDKSRLTETCADGGRQALVACRGTGLWEANAGKPDLQDPSRVVVFECESSNVARSTFFRAGVPNERTPINRSDCTAARAGLAMCDVCQGVPLCHQRGVVPPWRQYAASRASFGDGTVSQTSLAAGAYCNLTVAEFTDTSITLASHRYPCQTAGDIATQTLTAPTKFVVNINGWATQASGPGYLVWRFKSKFSLPPNRSETINQNIAYAILHGGRCPLGGCGCRPWACATPVCSMAEAADWSSCKCAFIGGEHAEGSLGCRFIRVILEIIFWMILAFSSFMLIMAIVHWFVNRRRRQAYAKSSQ